MENNISEKVAVFVIQSISCVVFAGLVFVITQSAMRNRIISGIVAILSGNILVYLIFFTETSLTYVFVVGAVISILSLLGIYVLVDRATGIGNNRLLITRNVNNGVVKNVLILFSGITMLIGIFCILGKSILIGVILWFISLEIITLLSIFNGGGENEQ